MANLITSKAISFLDIETTHLDPTRSAILSISIITDWEDGKQDTWTTKIKPKDIELKYASPEALEVCKYNKAEWEDAPAFEDVAWDIIKRIMWGPIVAHNIQFDVNHIKAVLGRYGYKEASMGTKVIKHKKFYKIGYPQIDTCGLAYLFLPTERQNLNTLREYFKLSNDNAHEAETDARDCRHVFYSILNHVSPEEQNERLV